MERKIGEIFTYNGKTYHAVPDYGCENCGFKDLSCNIRTFSEVKGACDSSMRKDNNNVIFKEVKKHMEIKNNQLTINIPEGMEIDLENSNLAKGIIKFKKKYITYDDILQECSTNFSGLRIHNHCLDKIIAISQLMNIAKYYNEDWNPNWRSLEESKYYIYYNTRSNIYGVANTYSTNYGNIYFRLDKDAQAVIENPNFRDILDAIYKN